jgi:uncharacterized protein (DUF1800 family)
MRRLNFVLFTAALIATTAASTTSAGRFDQRLTPERQLIHVLNRLTFGPRPGDVEQVRRMTVQKWIDQQLHPEQITENPVLDSKLKPLGTLDLAMWQILDEYPATPKALMLRPPSANALAALPPQQAIRLTTGSFQDRAAALTAMDPETRGRLLVALPQQVLDALPEDLRKEADSARKSEQDALQKERRRLMPALNEVLSQDQIRTINRGTVEEKVALVNSFTGEARERVLRALPLQAVADIPELRREAMSFRQPQELVNANLIESKIYRAVYSNRQLEEVLVDFWMNHFNVFNGKGPEKALLTSFERDAIRPHVFGHFKDLLLATARHPAMLFYLDNWQSQVQRDDVPLPPGGRRPGLNENYGRELMELHTLGVNGGYTQDDVIAVARAFTGWTIFDLQKFAEFQFNPGMHDRKEKVVLGHTIPAMGAEQDALQVIDILAHHPSTAKFISRKLAQRFVADDPPQALVDRMADTFMKTDGDLRAVLQTLFSSTEFLSEGAWQSKLKSPLEMVISAVRGLNVDVSDAFPLAQRIADLGEPLYGKLEPTGYPNTGEAWANTASVLGRINFSTALVTGQIPGLKVDVSRFNFKKPNAVARELLDFTPSQTSLDAIEKGIENKEATPSNLVMLVLSSPDFQRR